MAKVGCGYHMKARSVMCHEEFIFFLGQGNEETNETQIFFQTRLNDVEKQCSSEDFYRNFFVFKRTEQTTSLSINTSKHVSSRIRQMVESTDIYIFKKSRFINNNELK